MYVLSKRNVPHWKINLVKCISLKTLSEYKFVNWMHSLDAWITKYPFIFYLLFRLLCNYVAENNNIIKFYLELVIQK